MKSVAVNGFGGIDERITMQKYPQNALYTKNFRIGKNGSLKKRKKFEEVFSMPEKINGIWRGVVADIEQYLVISGSTVYRYIIGADQSPVEVGTAVNRECKMFRFGDAVYISALGYYGKFNGYTVQEVEGYVPTVATNCLPDGSGNALEQLNILTNKRKQFFTCDGTSSEYKLSESDISEIVYLKYCGNSIYSGYSVNTSTGVISFSNAPAAGINALEVCYKKGVAQAHKILNCTNATVYGGNSDSRVFLWGNISEPNYRYHSDLADGIPSAEYFPVSGYTVIGHGSINCISQQYGKQIIFTTDKAYYSQSELISDALGHTYSSFPVYALNGSKGCIINMDSCIAAGKPITLCHDGLTRWEQTDVENERNAVCFSHEIENSINAIVANSSDDPPKIFDFQALSELYVISGDDAFIYNYEHGCWYRHDGFGCDAYFVYGQSLYIGKNNKLMVYSEENEENASEAVWESAPFNTSDTGRCDITGFVTDVTVKGENDFEFSFKKSGRSTAPCFSFEDILQGKRRIYMRPGIKRGAPISLTIKNSGSGECTVSGMGFTVKERKRGERFGIQ